MEQKEMYAFVRQIVTNENGWYSDVLATFNEIGAAEGELTSYIEYIKGEDPRVAIRELNPTDNTMLRRVGWMSREYAFPMGQFIIIKIIVA